LLINSYPQRTLASSIMSIAYGIKVKGFSDPYVVNAVESMNGMAIAGVPGSFLVDIIPNLKHVPDWFPGAGFKQKAAYWAQVNRIVAELPFNHVVQQMVSPGHILHESNLNATFLKMTLLINRKKA
jgi:hypothetical protein